MAQPKVNFVKKAENGDGGNSAPKERKFKISLPIIVVLLSTVFFYGFGVMCVKVIWGFQKKQLEVIKDKKEALRKEFEKKDVEYEMDPFEVNIPSEEGMKQLQVAIAFQLQSEYGKKELIKKEDQVRDDILLLLSAKKEEELRDIQNRKKIQTEIVSRVNKFMSEKAQVKEVYFSNFFIE